MKGNKPEEKCTKDNAFFMNFNLREYLAHSILMFLGALSITTGFGLYQNNFEKTVIEKAYNYNIDPNYLTFLFLLTGISYIVLVFFKLSVVKLRIVSIVSLLSFFTWIVFTSAFFHIITEGRFLRILIVTAYNLVLCILVNMELYGRLYHGKQRNK